MEDAAITKSSQQRPPSGLAIAGFILSLIALLVAVVGTLGNAVGALLGESVSTSSRSESTVDVASIVALANAAETHLARDGASKLTTMPARRPTTNTRSKS